MDQHGFNMWIVVLTCISVLCVHCIVAEPATSGKCYSVAQIQCQPEMGNFWAAVINNDKQHICMYLEEVNSCTEQSLSNCAYEPYELELYEKDIVTTYTQPPYNCPLKRGTIERYSPHKGERSQATVNSYILVYVIACIKAAAQIMHI